jgi:cell division GTPase FtsZ
MKNDDLCNPYGDKMPVREALQSADRNMTDIVQDVMDVLSASKNRINELKRTLEECGESTVVSATATGLHAGRTAALKALGDSSLIPTVTNNVLLHIQGGIGFSIGQAAEAFSVVRKVVGPDAKIEMSTQREVSFGIDVRTTIMLMGNDLGSVQDLRELTKSNRLSSQRSLSIFENPIPVRRRPPILLPTG